MTPLILEPQAQPPGIGLGTAELIAADRPDAEAWRGHGR
jgi:hypothetical protein